MSASMVLAADLSQHGPDLLKAAFPIRYKFEQTYGVEWQKSSYDQRKKFLIQWYKDEATEAKKAVQDAREESQRQRDIAQADRDEKRRLAALKRAYTQSEIDEHKEKSETQRDFNRLISQESRDLQQLRSLNR